MPIEQFVVTEFGAGAKSPSFRFGGDHHDRVFHGVVPGGNLMSSKPLRRHQRDQRQYSLWTVFAFFVAHCFFASTQSLFNDLLFLRGFHCQFTLLTIHNALCGAVGFVVVANVSEERDRAQLRFGQIVRYCLPLAVCHSLKLYLQNKALDYLSPAFLSMMYGITPVLVCIACMAIGWERFRWNTLVLVVVATFGITLTAIGEVYTSALGTTLALVSIFLEVGRLLLLQHLLKHLGLTVSGLLVYTAPMEIAILAIGATIFELPWMMRSMSGFDLEFYGLLALNTAWALGTNITTYYFVQVSSALLTACTAPFKDVTTIVLSDLFVEPRHEHRITVFGYSLACVASFIYCVNKLGEDDESGGGIGRGASARLGGFGGAKAAVWGSAGRAGLGDEGGVGTGGAFKTSMEGAPLLGSTSGGGSSGGMVEGGVTSSRLASERRPGGSDAARAGFRSLLIGGAIAAAVGVNLYFLFVTPDEALQAAAAAPVTRAAEQVIQSATKRGVWAVAPDPPLPPTSTVPPPQPTTTKAAASEVNTSSSPPLAQVAPAAAPGAYQQSPEVTSTAGVESASGDGGNSSKTVSLAELGMGLGERASFVRRRCGTRWYCAS